MPTPDVPDIDLDPAGLSGIANSPAEALDHPDDAFALPADWLHLPPGELIDELADLAEWIANAGPQDGPAIGTALSGFSMMWGIFKGAMA